MAGQLTKADLEAAVATLATKDDLKKLASKNDLTEAVSDAVHTLSAQMQGAVQEGGRATGDR